jgi:DNA-binding transcriptional MerR regulator
MYHAEQSSARPDREEWTVNPQQAPDAGVYAISVASELTGVDPQMLRVYERRGLLEPGRTAGGTRRYSERDLERVRRIVTYIEAGLNLAGIERVFVLEAHTEALSEQVRELGGVPRRA